MHTTSVTDREDGEYLSTPWHNYKQGACLVARSGPTVGGQGERRLTEPPWTSLPRSGRRARTILALRCGRFELSFSSLVGFFHLWCVHLPRITLRVGSKRRGDTIFHVGDWQQILSLFLDLLCCDGHTVRYRNGLEGPQVPIHPRFLDIRINSGGSLLPMKTASSIPPMIIY